MILCIGLRWLRIENNWGKHVNRPYPSMVMSECGLFHVGVHAVDYTKVRNMIYVR
jgi:hypothetical protein